MTDIFESLHDPAPPEAGPERLECVKRRSRVRRQRRMIGASAAVAVVLAVTGVGVVTTLLGSSGGSSDCGGGVWFDGRGYLPEQFNDRVFDADDLGDVIGNVERTRTCPERNGDASELPVGTELRAAPDIDPALGFAAVVEGEVEFFRTFHPPKDLGPADVLSLRNVVEIGLNSDFDGSTRWATITDPAGIAVVVESITSAPTTEIHRADWNRMRAFIEFVRSDGLVTRSTYLVDTRTVAIGLDGVALSPAAADVIDAALTDAPTAIPRSDLRLTGPSGSTPVFDRTACRFDRPDLRAAPGDVLQIDGEQAGGVSISFVLVSGPKIEAYGIERDALAAGIALPAAAGPVTVELVSMNAGTSYCAVVDITR